MLYEWQKNIDRYIPEQLPGYNFICRIPVFIPVQEIGLTVWERRTQSLSFIHECVLSSINISTKSISELSVQFGVPENIMLQIVSQLDTEQLAAVSAGSIILTEKGRQVLQAQRKVQIVRNQMSRIFVNQITGEIADTPVNGAYKEPPRGVVYLNEIYPITLDFLRSRFEILSAIYRENRIEQIAFRPGAIVSAELYRILDIQYQILSYTKDFCFVYINQEDKSLAFRFQSGIQIYADALQNQLNKRENGAMNVLSQPIRTCTANFKDIELPHQLIEAVLSKAGQDKRLPAIETAYYMDRPLLDGEIEDILCHCSVFKADRILIEAPHIGELLNETVISALMSSHTHEVIINYNSCDFQAKRIIDKFRDYTKRRNDCKLTLRSIQSITSVRLYLGNTCAIWGAYCPNETVYRRRLYKLCAHITFDPKQIETLWSQSAT